MSMHEQLNRHAASMAICRKFADKFGAQIPEEVQGSFGFSEEPTYTYYLSSTLLNGEYVDKDKVLALYGDVFGRNGWTAKPDNGCRNYDWYKVIEGVRVTLYAAKDMPSAVEYKVPPKDFPIMLAYRVETVIDL